MPFPGSRTNGPTNWRTRPWTGARRKLLAGTGCQAAPSELVAEGRRGTGLYLTLALAARAGTAAVAGHADVAARALALLTAVTQAGAGPAGHFALAPPDWGD